MIFAVNNVSRDTGSRQILLPVAGLEVLGRMQCNYATREETSTKQCCKRTREEMTR